MNDDKQTTPADGGVIAASLRTAFPVSIPVFAGYIFLGAGYGILMGSLGYGPGWTALTSMLVFGGTIQYIVAVLMAARGRLEGDIRQEEEEGCP